MKQTVKIVALIVAIGLVVYFFTKTIVSQEGLPSEFIEGRTKGAELSSEIAALYDQSLNNLRQIGQYEKEGDIASAFDLLEEEITRNQDAQRKAIELSSELEKMARSIDRIKPDSAKIAATEAVSSEVTLVSRLVSYNEYFSQLFEALGEKFQDPQKYTNGKIEELLDNMNKESQAINELNARFNESLTKLDSLLQP
ncbi:MAG: hypothetical protein COU07_03645 [Candidatus Harrisonbacteria bacterium CG10_big_fil_rev_8_21_14_0_10_40_38]|uniref:DUF5667 domain-containing protein n=1 Tax=Candidatus Harrisonbacteria bacterium CG10_big_fil_rev_8_21_14_0_10_40_38 TaxID=1974583 RepID=A0A2H0URD8_9BACT|nr:MAG: hypothetical protein COU07_03645 [Candidatus Harrisonbacteria bacterium CG10_big_fil_rev_8_21_14_0_10_40_38]